MSSYETDADIAADEEERRNNLDVENAQLRAAIRAISEGKQSTFRQRGKEIGFLADDGEKCFIVHSDLIHAAEVAAGLV